MKASKIVECPHCNGTGVEHGQFIDSTPCPACQGRGSNRLSMREKQLAEALNGLVEAEAAIDLEYVKPVENRSVTAIEKACNLLNRAKGAARVALLSTGYQEEEE